MLRHLHRQTLLSAVVLFVMLAASIPAVAAKKKPTEADVRREQQQHKLTKTLQAESLGATTERAERLKALIADGTDLDQAYWQAGYVKYDDRWIPLGRPLFTSAEMKQREAYVNYRQQFWGNDEENLNIARWCAEFNLPDQARAHLMAILLNQPDNPQLRELLGYQRIAGQWMNEAEYRAARKAVEQFTENCKKWQPIVAGIRYGLTNPDPFEQNAALNRLHRIHDVDAVPAMLSILLPASEQAALNCVDQLLEIDHRDATLALCQAAMYAKWPRVKESATNAVKDRTRNHYVLALLSETQSQFNVSTMAQADRIPLAATNHYAATESPLHLQMTSHATLWHVGTVQLVARNETLFTKQIYFHDVTEQFYFEAISGGGDGHFSRGVIENGVDFQNRTISPFDIQLKFTELDRRAIDLTRNQLAAIENENQQIRDRNQRLLSLLSDTTDLPSGSSLNEAWQWWTASQDVDVTKKDRVIEVSETIGTSVTTYLFQSCFIKGTPVYSEVGPVPIETLRVGDRVLAQNVDTGELTYKPVIRTTVRRPRPLVKITLGNETITATRGHPFWVAGTGWVKSRDLKPGHMLHTATGAVKVDSVVEAPEQETYNLIVDAFHTYFVGNERALVHDVSLTTPTDAVVPGLIKR